MENNTYFDEMYRIGHEGPELHDGPNAGAGRDLRDRSRNTENKCIRDDTAAAVSADWHCLPADDRPEAGQNGRNGSDRRGGRK